MLKNCKKRQIFEILFTYIKIFFVTFFSFFFFYPNQRDSKPEKEKNMYCYAFFASKLVEKTTIAQKVDFRDTSLRHNVS